MDGNSLARAFRFEHKTNYPWVCPLCPAKCLGSARLYDHAEEHINFPGMLEMLRKSINQHCRADKKNAFNARYPENGVGLVNKKKEQLKAQLGVTDRDLLSAAVCRAIVDGSHSLNLSEQSWFQDAVQSAIDIGFNACAGRRSKPVAKELVPSRRTITPLVDLLCRNAKEQFVKPNIDQAKSTGATLCSDGRSNINHDPLIVIGVQTSTSFVPLGTFNASVNKKSASYLCALSSFRTLS